VIVLYSDNLKQLLIPTGDDKMKAVWKVTSVCVGIALALAFVVYVQYVESLSVLVPSKSSIPESLYLKNAFVNGSKNAIFIDVTAVNIDHGYTSQISSGIVKNEAGTTVAIDRNIDVTLPMGQSITVRINYEGTLPFGQYTIILATEAGCQFVSPSFNIS
jgi:hypothetical protein